MTTVSLGQAVPNLQLPATRNKLLSLTDFAGKKLLLYSYPKDNTPGCTQEGQAFRDHIQQFQALNTEILGVSSDSVKMHEGFKCKQAFPFDLLSDQDEQLCQLFDVIKMKTLDTINLH